jgi:imidazolonepropionase-like amidohydrolase
MDALPLPADGLFTLTREGLYCPAAEAWIEGTANRAAALGLASTREGFRADIAVHATDDFRRCLTGSASVCVRWRGPAGVLVTRRREP